MSCQRVLLLPLAIFALLGACKEDSDPAPSKPARLSVEELQDPETCKGCHPTHYREWKASMHAYAADDPVFIAMNALGQQETNGELGNFCVNCHAPMAVRAGMTDGGIVAEDTPQHLKGVTCYFCHNVENVEGANNAEVTLANDDIMRGSIIEPIEPSAHGVSFSRYMDRYNPESSSFCGGCHDIVLNDKVHLERTFAEYNESIFSDHGTSAFITCSGCHMPSREGLAAIDTGTEDSVATRTVHSHLWPGVDVAMTPWSDAEKYEAAVTCALDQSVSFKEDLSGQGETGGPLYVIEIQAGHKMPSGASQDRRLWVEMIAYDADDKVVCTSGAVPEGVAVAGFQEPGAHCGWTGADAPGVEQRFPLYRDKIFDEDGNETHMFWRAAPSDEFDSGVLAVALPAATMVRADGTVEPHTENIEFSGLPDSAVRATVRLKMRPMDHDVLDELVEAELLDESIHDEVRTFTIASGTVDFQRNGIWEAMPNPERSTDCYAAFFCAFDAEAPNCD